MKKCETRAYPSGTPRSQPNGLPKLTTPTCTEVPPARDVKGPKNIIVNN